MHKRPFSRSSFQTLTEAFCQTLNAEDYAFMEFIEKQFVMAPIIAVDGRIM
jgi:hypothetical protein